MNSPPPARPRHHLGLLVLLAFAVAIAGLVTVITPGMWLLLLVSLAAAVLLSGVLARAVGLPAPVSAVIPLLVASLFLVARFASDTAVLGVLPTPATAERFLELYRDGFVALAWQAPPAVITEPIAFLLAMGLAAVVLIAETLAFTLGRPALVGIPLLVVLLVPSIPPDTRASAFAFLGVASAYLWLLLDGRAHPRLQLPRVLGIGAVAMAAALVVPGILPATDRDDLAAGAPGSLATGVNPLLNLGEDLRRGDDRVVVTYSTGSGDPYYLRLTEIRDFTGQSWAPDQPLLRPQNRPTAMPLLRDNRDVPFEREIGVFVIGNLVSPWLPVPYPTTSIHELVGDWQYVPESYTIASNTALAAGESYTARSNRLQPTPEQLRSAGRTVPAGFEGYLELPEVPDIIAETARAVTADADTNYERALALQGHLRSMPYRYSERAPITGGFDHTGMDALAAFLDVKAGYCIHFASAMAAMARVLGMPARIIVGFQPGERESGVNGAPDLFTVTSRDLHAWPELYFADVGWIAFEPTPSRGSVPEYARAGATGVPSVGIPRDGGALPDIPELSDASVTGARGGAATVDVRGIAAATGVTLLAVGIVLLPLSVRALRRRRILAGLRDGTADAREAWRELLATVQDTGLALPETLTPREAIARLTRLHDVRAPGRDALRRLGAAVERAGYGRPDTDANPHPELAADLEAATAALYARLDRGARLHARMLPPSLLRRMPHPVAAHA